jgi:hypothetical protein
MAQKINVAQNLIHRVVKLINNGETKDCLPTIYNILKNNDFMSPKNKNMLLAADLKKDKNKKYVSHTNIPIISSKL